MWASQIEAGGDLPWFSSLKCPIGMPMWHLSNIPFESAIQISVGLVFSLFNVPNRAIPSSSLHE